MVHDAKETERLGNDRACDAGCKLAAFAPIVVLCFALVACSNSSSHPVAQPAIPVFSAIAERKNVPVELHAIGAVEAYSSVAIRTQITGELTGVYFREGQDVRRGDLLFVLDERALEAELRKQQGNLARGRAQAVLAETQRKRYAALIQEGVVAKEQYDQVRANADALEAAVQADEGAVESARIQLSYCSIHSPLNGRVGSLLVHSGNVIKANDAALVNINQIEPIYVSFALPQQDLAEIKHFAGARSLGVQASIEADPKPERGKLTFIDNAIDAATGTVRLKGEFANSDRRLWPGQFVDVTLTLNSEPDAILVPSQAVTTGQQGQLVFVIRPDMTIEVRPVTISRAFDGQTVIERGVVAGERVVSEGQLRLVAGSKVQIKDSVPPPSGPRDIKDQPEHRRGQGS